MTSPTGKEARANNKPHREKKKAAKADDDKDKSDIHIKHKDAKGDESSITIAVPAE